MPVKAEIVLTAEQLREAVELWAEYNFEGANVERVEIRGPTKPDPGEPYGGGPGAVLVRMELQTANDAARRDRSYRDGGGDR